MMEIKRASIITTPDVTPRNSMLFGINQAPSQLSMPDQLELQDFLKRFHPSDETMSIPEVEDEDEDELEEGEGQYDSGADDVGHDRPVGSITPNEATHNTIKTFDLSLNSNSNNNNNNSLEMLSPFNLTIPPLLQPVVPAAASPLSSNTCDFSVSSELSQSSEPPFLMPHPLPHVPTRRYSMEGLCDLQPAPGQVGGAELKKHKVYSSFIDLTSVKSSSSSSSRGKSFHKSIDDLDEGSSSLGKINEDSPRLRFRAVSLSKLKGFSSSSEKENGEKSRRRLFKGGSNKRAERPLSANVPSVTTDPQLNKPPSVKNKVSSISVVV